MVNTPLNDNHCWWKSIWRDSGSNVNRISDGDLKKRTVTLSRQVDFTGRLNGWTHQAEWFKGACWPWWRYALLCHSSLYNWRNFRPIRSINLLITRVDTCHLLDSICSIQPVFAFPHNPSVYIIITTVAIIICRAADVLIALGANGWTGGYPLLAYRWGASEQPLTSWACY